MRATHHDPRLLLAALVAALAFALLAAGQPLDLNDLGLFSDSAPAVETRAPEPTGTPAWVEDPMASPITQLRSP